MKLAKLILTLFLLLNLTSCKSEVVARGIDQKQANEIVSIFSKSKISAKVSRDSNSKKLLMISVDKSDYEEAASILTQKGLPREKGTSFSEVISHHGILPDSKRMEDLRLDKALALELEENLSKLNGLSSVSVIVRKESLKDKTKPLVSILLIKKTGTTDLDYEGIVKIVQTLVPGIQVENINIAEESEPEDTYLSDNYAKNLDWDNPKLIKLKKFLGQFSVAKDDYSRLILFFITSIFISFFIGAVLVSCYFKFRNIKKEKSKIVEISSKDLLGKNVNKKE